MNKSRLLTEIVEETTHQGCQFAKGLGEGLLFAYAAPTIIRRWVNAKSDAKGIGTLLGFFPSMFSLMVGIGEVLSGEFSDYYYALPVIAAVGNPLSGLYELVRYSAVNVKERRHHKVR